MKEFPMISYREFDRWLEDGRIRFLVDVREPWMYENDRILGSVNIPYEEIEQNIDRIPREGMTVCFTVTGGQRAWQCAEISGEWDMRWRIWREEC